jgi:N-acetylglucosaminyldiphosphoundecaprenol N-acetyl-beta-D-mannosaminyltransferase
LETVPILGVNTHAQTFDAAIQTLLHWATDAKQRRYVCFTAVYMLMMATRDEHLREGVNNADMNPADGMPLVWVQRRRGYPQAERVYAADVMEALCEASARYDVTHYLWGGSPEVTSRLVENLCEWYPGIKIAGHHSPPFAPLEARPKPEVIERINGANANIVWVCLGSVKQDSWMPMYRPYLNAPVLLGVGAAFDFLAGTKPQAPKWMQRSGLEWFFRLMTEPRRLAKRYLLYNPLFIYHVLREQYSLSK